MNIVSLLKMEAKENNESNKRILILRLLSLVMSFYFIVLIGMFIPIDHPFLIILGIAGMITYAIAFCLSYKNRSLVVFFFHSMITVLWIMTFVYIFGWDCGVQHFIFAMVVVACFATIGKWKLKILYIAFLCALRMGLYFYTRVREPQFIISSELSIAFQFINTITIFVYISVISLVISNYSQEAEHKLILYNKKLEKMANIDELTGLYNRRSMISYLEKLQKKGNQRTPVTIVIGDIDFFKRFNDEYGHDCGDMVLKELAVLLEKCMEEKGRVARWGGEEFLFLFEDMNGDDTLVALSNMLNQIRSNNFCYNDLQLHITMTFGEEEYDGVDYESTLKKADTKLYMGKAAGRNQIIY